MKPQFYNVNAQELAQQYLSKTFEEVHQSWSQFLPSIIQNPNARILDLGAGAGRDSKYLAELAEKSHNSNKSSDKSTGTSTHNNVQVIAVEPAQALSTIGQHTTKGLNVKWLEPTFRMVI